MSTYDMFNINVTKIPLLEFFQMLILDFIKVRMYIDKFLNLVINQKGWGFKYFTFMGKKRWKWIG